MLPFSEAEFVAVFARFNAAVWPLQIVVHLAGAACVAALFLHRVPRFGSRFIALTLGFMWLAAGVAYHGLFFSRINPAALGFAAAFVVQAVALGVIGLRCGLRFEPRRDARTLVGLGLIAYAILVYPLWSLLLGRPYLETPTFGLTPCPVVLFTFAFLLLARPAPPRLLVIIPLLWALIGGSAAILLGMPQDFLLGASALVGVWLLLPQRSRPASGALV